MVLAILFEITSPTRSLRLPRGPVRVLVSAILEGLGVCVAQLRHSGLDARNIAAQHSQARRLLQLGAGLLQPQVEQFLAQIAVLRRSVPPGCRIFRFQTFS